MELGIDRLLCDLRKIGVAVEGPLQSGKLKWALIPVYTIQVGRFVGQIVRLAVPAADDYPQTPPGGVYVSPKIIPPGEMAGLRIHDRSNETCGLPGEWQYWSRPIPEGTWTPHNGAKRLIAHWNAVMMNV